MFKIIYDLSGLSDADRTQYCRDYALYLGLNPDENRIDTIWMPNDFGRTLIAYARRGTTDLLRDIHGIDVTSLVKEDGPGYVSFQASGVNRKGRKEIAVGAYATSGLSGDRLAAGVATAQTRALRRLTLQFVGGGLLDESEVSSQPIQGMLALVAAPAVQPKVKPNTQVGKLVKDLTPNPPVPLSEPAPLVDQANAILAQQQPEPEKPNRGRKRKNIVDIGAESVVDTVSNPSPRLVEHLLDSQKINVQPNTPIPNADLLPSKPIQPVSIAAETPQVAEVKPAKVASVLTEVEQKQVKARLAPFWVDILPKGGMTAEDGLSLWSKLIKFANCYFPEESNYKLWTIDKWESFFDFLEEMNTNKGAKALVDYINSKIK